MSLNFCHSYSLLQDLSQNMDGLPYTYYDYTSEFSGNFPFPADNPSRTPPLAIPKRDSVSALRSEVGYTSSGCSSHAGSPSSITSNGGFSPGLFQRSISSHSLHKNLEAYSPMNVSPSPPLPSYFESETSSVRKAMSTGDLQIQGVNLAHNSQQRSNSPLADEVSILESMSRASPYSPEEKKERIERYRSKRNLRNFNKKIKYECRKTLADSRPRIRGRFARNDEIEKTHQSQWDHSGVEEYDEDSDNWINFLDTFSANLMP